MGIILGFRFVWRGFPWKNGCGFGRDVGVERGMDFGKSPKIQMDSSAGYKNTTVNQYGLLYRYIILCMDVEIKG